MVESSLRVAQLRGPSTNVLSHPETGLGKSNRAVLVVAWRKAEDRLQAMCDGKRSGFHRKSIAFLMRNALWNDACPTIRPCEMESLRTNRGGQGR